MGKFNKFWVTLAGLAATAAEAYFGFGAASGIAGVVDMAIPALTAAGVLGVANQ
jgi:hypothetical protein